MANIEDSFKQVLEDFKKRLKPDEQAEFSITTISDLQNAMNNLQEHQRKSKTAQNLKRIEPFLQAMAQYKEIIEVFLNTSSLLCFVWGPMKFMLLVAGNYKKAFDVLLDAYKQISENFPLLLRYRSMFDQNNHMKKVIVWIYEDILKFHLRALRIFSQPAWMKLFTATWKDFQESFKPILNDLVRHRELIESTASLERIQESRDAQLQFQASLAALEQEQTHTRTLAVISWLSAVDADEDQTRFSSTRYENIPNTGRWILDVPSIQAWLDLNITSTPIVWVNGKPGAGKTILASVLIEDCSRIVELSKDVSFAFFYCRDKDEQRNKFTSVAKSMLSQLLRQQPAILPYLYDECLKSAKVTLTSPQDCIKLLGTVLQAVPKTFLIVDGIDECELKERKAMLNFFTSTITGDDIVPGKVRALFISQQLNDIMTGLHMADSIQLTKDHIELDIRDFAVKRALEIQNKFNLMPDPMPDPAREHIVKLVCGGADGMFLFAKLVLQNLYDQRNLVNVYKELRPDTFPKGFDEAYARIVNRIFTNPSLAQRETAKKILGWITFSKRPLKWHEIQGATCVDLQQRVVNFEGRQMPGHIRDICGSLVEILPGDRVQLVHTTARQYLTDVKSLDTKESFLDTHKEETKLAILCMQYLTFPYFETNICHDEMVRFVKRGCYAFLDYASLHWYHHLEATLVSLKSMELGNSTDLGMAINEFFEMYEPGPTHAEKIKKDFIERCSAVEDTDCYEALLLLLCHAKASRIAKEKLEALGPLGNNISKIRTILEELGRKPSPNSTPNPSHDGNTQQTLQLFYGDKWYKCSRHACYYFHEGFRDEKDLTTHTNRHEKPFCCTEMGCTRMFIGWSSEKELKKHMSHYHPDPEVFKWKFPYVKKSAATFQCGICEKKYSRANSLSTHQLREHAKTRPFSCEVCKKGFVRKYELERHEGIHKGKGEGNEVGDTGVMEGGSQEEDKM